jgi:phosphoglycolate phosphatase-like HAD superfamily hydrolase
MPKIRNIVFDCNETILDLATVTLCFSDCLASRA